MQSATRLSCRVWPVKGLALALAIISPWLLSGCSTEAECGDVVCPDFQVHETPFNPDWGFVGAFAGARECAACHQATPNVPGVMYHQGEDVSPYTGWRHTMMANAFADPYFQAAMTSETSLMPHLAGFIEDKCLTCHTPMARTHAVHSGVGLDEDGYYRFEQALSDMHAREGVSCTVCHQIQPDGLGQPESFSGEYNISPDQRDIFGPYPRPRGQSMQNQVAYDPVYSPHIGESALCASCHTLFTPVVDVNTNQPAGTEFPEQTPFLEWLNSIYSPPRGGDKHCQTCHMPQPEAGYATKIATRMGRPPPRGWPRRTPFAYHKLVGGNTHMLTILRNFREPLGLAGTTEAGFDAKIAETREFLMSEAAKLEILDATIGRQTIEIPVRITNWTGHKLPTGFPARRMWVHMQVSNERGEVLFESGAVDENGRIALDAEHTRAHCLEIGKQASGAEYRDCYEPHRQVINSPQQVAIYESVMGDVNGRLNYVLLYGSEYLKDNRIPPIGFDRSLVGADGVTAVQGRAAADPNFSPDFPDDGSGRALVRYRIDTPPDAELLNIRARLLFQSVRPAFVAALNAGDDPRVNRFHKMYAAVPPLPEILAVAESQVQGQIAEQADQ